jgi:hypothetical protein
MSEPHETRNSEQIQHDIERTRAEMRAFGDSYAARSRS